MSYHHSTLGWKQAQKGWRQVCDPEYHESECNKALLQGGYVVIIALVILGIFLERAPRTGLAPIAPSYVTEKTT